MIVAGFGFRQGATLASLQSALALTQGAEAIATAEDKAHALADFAHLTGLPLIAVTKVQLQAHARPGSPRAKSLYGTGSVAESAALAAAGPGARLTQPRVTTPDAQVVIALAESAP